MASLSPILALLLALSMLVSPVAGATDTQQSELPPFTVSVDYADSVGVSLGLTRDTSGLPLVFLKKGVDAFYLTSETAIIDKQTVSYRKIDGDLVPASTPGAISIPTAELMNFISAATGQLPEPTQEDAMALAYFAQGLMTSISPDALSIAPRGNGVAISLDVDRFLAELDQAVPQTLTTFAAQLDPTIQKYSAALLGMPVTAAQLAEVWPELELSSIRTGLTISLTVVPTADGVNILGSVSDFAFVLRIAGDEVQIRFTTPDGTVYPIDFADFATLASIFGDLPGQIMHRITTEEATTDALGYPEKVGYTINIDTTAIAGYLNDGIAATIANNAATMDPLLVKYQPWLELIAPELAGMTAEALSAWLKAEQPITLPAITGYYSQYNTRLACIIDSEIVGDFGTLTLKGSLQNTRYNTYTGGSSPYTLTLTLNDGYEAFVATLSDSNPDRYTQHVAVDFSEPVFGLFSTLTYTMNENIDGEFIVINTDTNVFRYAFAAQEQYMEMKAGPVSCTLRETAGENWQLNLSMPDFFADAHWNENAFRLDSTYLGLDVSISDEAALISGYITPDEYTRYDFGLNYQETDGFMGSFLNAYIVGDDVNVACVALSERLYLTIDGELYSLVRDSQTEAFLYCHNYGIEATICPEVDGSLYTLHIYSGYKGADSTAEPMCTITIDTDPASMALPDGAQPTDAETFLLTLIDLFE